MLRALISLTTREIWSGGAELGGRVRLARGRGGGTTFITAPGVCAVVAGINSIESATAMAKRKTIALVPRRVGFIDIGPTVVLVEEISRRPDPNLPGKRD